MTRRTSDQAEVPKDLPNSVAKHPFRLPGILITHSSQKCSQIYLQGGQQSDMPIHQLPAHIFMSDHKRRIMLPVDSDLKEIREVL